MSRTNRPTLRTVAQAAQVSLPTVSQVMRGVGRISEDTRQKVRAAAEHVGYVPDHRAISVRTGQSNEVTIIIHDIRNSFNAELILGVSARLEAAGYFLSIMDAKGDPARLEELVRTVISKNCAGLLWVPSERLDPRIVELLEKQNFPNVAFLRGLQKTQFPSLRIANEEAIQSAMRYLHELGHDRIAFAGGEGDNQTRRQRIQGYRNGLKDIPKNEAIILDFEDSKAGGFQCALEFDQANQDITAVICNGDEFAIGFCLGLQRRGFEPGKDISVIGFDDIMEARMITPPLTTLSVSPFQFGKRLAEIFLKINKNEGVPPHREKISAKLIIRETTGAPKK